MARIKVSCEDEQSRHPSLLLKTADNCLDEHTDTLDNNSNNHRKFSFMLEQLKLMSRSKFRRHQSPQLTIFTYLPHASSAVAYSLLEQNVLHLPSVGTLAKVMR